MAGSKTKTVKKAASDTIAQPVAQKPTTMEMPATKIEAGPAPAKTPIPEGKANEGEDALTTITSPFRDWFAYIKSNVVRYYLGLLKINVVSGVVWLVLAAILFILTLVTGFGMVAAGIVADISDIPGVILLNGALLVICAIIAVVCVLVMMWVVATIRLSCITFTDAEFNKKPFSIRATFGAMKWKVLKYLILECAIKLVLAIPLVIIALLSVGALIGGSSLQGGSVAGALVGMMGLMIGYLLILAYIVAVYLIGYGFFAQFWAYGVMIEGRGIRDALINGLRLIKRNPIEVFVFDFVWLIGLVILAIISWVILLPLGILRMIVEFASAFAGPVVYLVATILVVTLQIVIGLLINTAIETFSLPTHYLFWKRVNK